MGAGAWDGLGRTYIGGNCGGAGMAGVGDGVGGFVGRFLHWM